MPHLPAIGEMSLNVVVGGIEPTPKVIEGQIVSREILSLTLSFDHDVIDGAPAARFATRMKALIEVAHGLDHLNADERLTDGRLKGRNASAPEMKISG